MKVPLEIIVGLITLCGVLTNAMLNMLSSKHKTHSDQTIETMKVQKDLIDTLFEENQTLSKRVDEIDESLKEERREFQEELVKTREAYNQLKIVAKK